METYKLHPEADLAISLVEAAPWWGSMAAAYQSENRARSAIRKVVAVLKREDVPIQDLLNAIDVATHAFLRNGKTPGNWESWLLKGARGRWRTKEKIRQMESVAAIVEAADVREKTRQAQAIGHDGPDISPELAASGAASDAVEEPLDIESDEGKAMLEKLRGSFVTADSGDGD